MNWVGCGECDMEFPCHNGQHRCIRLVSPGLYSELARDEPPRISREKVRVIYGPCSDFSARPSSGEGKEPGGELRLAVVSYLSKRVGKPVSTAGVTEATGYNYSGVSRVMGKLRRKGVISKQRDGKGKVLWIVTEEIGNEDQSYGWDDGGDDED